MKILRLKEIMTTKGITGKQLASDLGTTEATISNLAKGDALPRKDMLVSLAKYLDVDLRDMFVSTKEKSVNETIDDIHRMLDDIREYD